jgi:hypothetical protein
LLHNWSALGLANFLDHLPSLTLIFWTHDICGIQSIHVGQNLRISDDVVPVVDPVFLVNPVYKFLFQYCVMVVAPIVF